MKIATIVGARPQFIKAAAVSRKIRNQFDEILVHTGQHYDYEMSEIFFRELDLPNPDYNLDIGSGNHGFQTGKMLERIEEVLLKENPGLVLIYGDTNSTLAGAISAAKLHIPVGHIEAGLRSFDRSMPEEINRIVADHVSTLLFCPTTSAVENLSHEGIHRGVILTGDVMTDVLYRHREIAISHSRIIGDLNLIREDYCLATIHRASNTDNPESLISILTAFKECGKKIVFAIHPRTRKKISEFGLQSVVPDNVLLINPVGYLDMLALIINSSKIITDSGGLQKEAYILGKPCITLRDSTEWVETVDLGWNILVGTDLQKIVHAIHSFNPISSRKTIYGNGNAADAINEAIKKFFKEDS